MTVTCAIHQPNFFPWLGYFDKIKRADVFVFLDNVQNQKTGGNWVNRVKLNCHNTEKWFTCPIKRPSGVVNINQVEFSDDGWKANFLGVLESYYKNYPSYHSVMEWVKGVLVQHNNNLLCDFNILAIKELATKLNVDTKFIKQSDLGIKDLSTNLLVKICQAVGADNYLCGGGAGSYQDDELFKKENISVTYQKFQMEPYGDTKKYLPGLSSLDYLMSKNDCI